MLGLASKLRREASRLYENARARLETETRCLASLRKRIHENINYTQIQRKITQEAQEAQETQGFFQSYPP